MAVDTVDYYDCVYWPNIYFGMHTLMITHSIYPLDIYGSFGDFMVRGPLKICIFNITEV